MQYIKNYAKHINMVGVFSKKSPFLSRLFQGSRESTELIIVPFYLEKMPCFMKIYHLWKV